MAAFFILRNNDSVYSFALTSLLEITDLINFNLMYILVLPLT